MRIESHPRFFSMPPSWESGLCHDEGEATPEPAPPRILMDSGPDAPPPTGDSDLARIEELLERCWRELDTADLNVKLTDIVRLLEFKARLRPAADADAVFWSLINQLRREELGDH